MCIKESSQQPQQKDSEEGESSAVSEASNGDGQALPMAPDVSKDSVSFFCFVVRDVSFAGSPKSKDVITLNPYETVEVLLESVSKSFGYEMNTFALAYQRLASLEDVEITDLALNTPISDVGFTPNMSHNNLVLMRSKNLVAPVRIEDDANTASALSHSKNKSSTSNLEENGTTNRKVDDDDLSLGASASPTNSSKAFDKYIPKYNSNLGKEEGASLAADGFVNGSSSQSNCISYVGLVNHAMTCYLNSLLQSLYMTPEFRNALYRWEFKGTDEEGLKSIPFQLQKLFLQLQTASRCAVETTNLTRSFGWDSSEVWQQHDIQELYRVMFEALEESFKNTDQAELINDLYQGKMKDYVKCLECGTENAREDSFLDIPLPIRSFGSNVAYKSVEEGLKAFVEPELLTGNNKYECAKCAAHCEAHKGLKFTRFPYLLTLHLKRFDFDYQTLHRIKLNDKVVFPTILDLNGFMENSDPLSAEESSETAVVASSPAEETVGGLTMDKVDDGSTTDSGSAPDAEDNSSLGCSTSNHTLNDTDTQDEDEGVDVSSAYNEKNRLLSASNGPYVYELFSIMVHSGSASGGHYYAYIKDFKTGEWFCFNDQVVSRITYDDIRKTYGGSAGRGFYSSWSSSANAYMLMYRKADKDKNAETVLESDFPAHIQSLVQKMVSEEAAEREAREIERNTVKINLFCLHPHTKNLVEKKLKIHKDTTLRQATELAHEELELSGVVTVDRCRLVKYDEADFSIECSFSDADDQPIAEVLGGVRSMAKFDLFLEVREENRAFEEYKPGGITFRVYTINLSTDEVEGPQTVRADANLTVRAFKELLASTFSTCAANMRIVRQKHHRQNFKPLLSDSKTLQEEGFYRSSKIFVEASGVERPEFFAGSQMFSILERHCHTIAIYVNLPERTDEVLKELGIPKYDPELEAEKEREEAKSNEQSKSVQDAVSLKNQVADNDIVNNCDSPSLLNGSQLPSDCPVSLPSEPPSVTLAPSSANLASSSVTLAPPSVSSAPPSVTPAPLSVQSTSPSVTLAAPLVTHAASSVTSAAPSVTSAVPSVTLAPPTVTSAAEAVVLSAGTSSRPKTKRRGPRRRNVVERPLSPSDEDEEDDATASISSCAATALNGDQSTSEDSSLTSDSDRTLIGDPPEDNYSDQSNDYHNVSSPEENAEEGKSSEDALTNKFDEYYSTFPWDEYDGRQPQKRYFRATYTDKDALKVYIDQRITIGQLKKELQKYANVSEQHFKLIRVFSNIHELEYSRMNEMLSSTCDETLFKIQLGKALQPGEYEGKVFMLEPENSDAPSKFLVDFVTRKQDTVAVVKEAIVKEVNATSNVPMDASQFRLRKKIWKNPQTVFLDHQVFDQDIMLYANWEFYLQDMKAAEPKNDPEELCVFVKRFYPSAYTTDPLKDITLAQPTVEALREKLSKLSGIAEENVEFAKGKATFPCDMAVLDIPTGLNWESFSGSLDQRPLYIIDDGTVIYYKDRSETLKSLSESERSELEAQENARLKDWACTPSAHTTTPAPSSSTKGREKGLKIYFDKTSSH